MKQLFQALSKTDDGAFVINEQRQIIFWNEAAQTILGYKSHEAINRPCYEVLRGRDEQGHMLCQHYCQMTTRAGQGDTLPNIDMYALTNNGKGQWINMTTFALPTGSEDSSYLIVHLFRDATQKKSNEHFVEEIIEATRGLQHEKQQPDIVTIDPIPDPAYDTLTPREREVLVLLARGLSTNKMANMLYISQATIRNHIQSIMSKLKVHSRLEIVTYAYQQGLVDTNDQ